ncbi:MAG: RlmE family RNA methyltransferase [Chloroflexi bacterium]|nr:RlmE family RNA methyltransferase [Chloroflexota bacterium]
MAWRKQQSQDRFFQQAKKEGYRARSAYKLLEINDKFHLIRPGDKILDLGAAPGSWSQVAAKLGKAPKIVAVDIQPIEPLPGVQTIQGDITKEETIAKIADALPEGADLVLSDIARAASGIRFADHARSIQLAQAALEIARRFLKPNGAFVVKVFQGEDLRDFVEETKRWFETVKVFRPQASRQESDEHFVVCQRPRKETSK